MKAKLCPIKIGAKGIKDFLCTACYRAFFIILFFVFIDIVIGEFIFYKYVFLAETQKIDAQEDILKFDKETYQSVLEKLPSESTGSSSTSSSIANPASVYCAQQGGELVIKIKEDGSQYGLCTFNDGSTCPLDDFYNGKCSKGNAGE